jgi:hypothetical protein
MLELEEEAIHAYLDHYGADLVYNQRHTRELCPCLSSSVSLGILMVFDLESFELARRMRELRLRQGLKQAELARRMGVEPSTVSLCVANGWCPGVACRCWPLRWDLTWTNSAGRRRCAWPSM